MMRDAQVADSRVLLLLTVGADPRSHLGGNPSEARRGTFQRDPESLAGA